MMRTLQAASPPLSPASISASVSSSLSTLFRPIQVGPIHNIHAIWPLCVITLASMYIILTLPIATPAAILIQFQLMRIITHSNRSADDQIDDADIDSDSDDESSVHDTKSPPSPLCIEVVISDSADSPQQNTRDLDKNLIQRTSLQSASQDDELTSLLSSSSSSSSVNISSPSLVGNGSMILSGSGFDIAAMNIVHFPNSNNDTSCTAVAVVDDDDDVVGHSMVPPLSTSRLWMFWSAITLSTDKQYGNNKQWSHSLDQNLVVCV